MPRFHNIDGEQVQFTPEEEAARDAEEADEAASRPLNDWHREMAVLDGQVTARMVEDIVDALVPLGASLPSQVTDLMAARKAKRSQKP